MKKLQFIFTSILAIILFTACASTPDSQTGAKHATHEKSSPKSVLSVQKSPEDIFIESLEGITVKKVSSPKEITLGKAFADPFVFSPASVHFFRLHGR